MKGETRGFTAKPHPQDTRSVAIVEEGVNGTGKKGEQASSCAMCRDEEVAKGAVKERFQRDLVLTLASENLRF